MGVFEIAKGKDMTLIEIAKDVSIEDIKKYTTANFKVSKKLINFKL
jgi:acyl CoA:acetate/3-ketoacid CoA transferase beta subunit